MAFKPVGVDENSDFPPRVRTRLGDIYASVASLTSFGTRVSTVEEDVAAKADVGHVHDAAAITTGLLALERLPAGAIFTVKWNSSLSVWQYNGVTITQRPTTRTNLRMMAIGTASAAPSFAIADDFWLSEV